MTQAMKDSHVLHTKENLEWDWELVGAILMVSPSVSSERTLATVVVFLIERHFSCFCSGQTKP